MFSSPMHRSLHFRSFIFSSMAPSPTCMLSSTEWSNFGRKRKAIPVHSHPRGEQRSRYFLQLPYRFGIPLILVSILMHWMLRQSLLLVVIEDREDSASDLKWFFSTYGCSPIAIIFVLIISFLVFWWVVITRCMKIADGDSSGWKLQLSHRSSLSQPKRSAAARGTVCSITMGRDEEIRTWEWRGLWSLWTF